MEAASSFVDFSIEELLPFALEIVLTRHHLRWRNRVHLISWKLNCLFVPFSTFSFASLLVWFLLHVHGRLLPGLAQFYVAWFRISVSFYRWLLFLLTEHSFDLDQFTLNAFLSQQQAFWLMKSTNFMIVFARYFDLYNGHDFFIWVHFCAFLAKVFYLFEKTV